MEKSHLSEHLRKSILVYTIISGLVLAAVAATISIVPLYRTMRAQREDKLLSMLHNRAAAVETFLWETREIAQQIASRTSVRDALERIFRDKTQAKAAAVAIHQSLNDAVGSTPGVISTYCFDKTGMPLTHAGVTLPLSAHAWLHKNLDESITFLPLRTRSGYRLLYRIPVRNRDDNLLGVLVLLYDFETLRNRLVRLPDRGVHEDTFIGSMDSGKITVFLDMRGRERKANHGQMTPRVIKALQRAIDKKVGFLEEDDTLSETELFAYRPIPNTDWGIAIRQSYRTLLADIDDLIFRIIGIVCLLVLVIGAGMFLLLRPLTGKLVMHSRELEDRVEQQTARLESERERLLAITGKLQDQKKKLEAANEDLDAFTRTVAHDLRTPLATIQGFADLLLDSEQIKKDEESRDMLSRVAAKSRQMANQIKALLRYARAGKATLDRKYVKLSRVAEEISADLRVEYCDLCVDVSIQPDMKVFSDELLLYSIMENLLGNAWKYSSKTVNPRIEVGVEDLNGESVYFVRDSGMGFDMLFAEKLFQPFQRLHSDAQFAGTGIGLSTVKRIIEQHGGRVWAEGKLGEGATFRFVLPGEPV